MATRLSIGLIVLSLFSVISCSDVPMPGGTINISPDRPDVLKAANFAINEFNKKSKDDYLCKLIKVISAQSQVVEGINYFLEVQIGRTQCKNDANSDVQSCNLFQDSKLSQVSVCRFQVWDIPWLNKETLTSYSCTAQ
ncbi:cystatin-like [Pelobates fuscus]|uniref:cystatin-like n=1 Tax=Pelobates fuscus TaxID=191477 RepID=UPI002FE46262